MMLSVTIRRYFAVSVEAAIDGMGWRVGYYVATPSGWPWLRFIDGYGTRWQAERHAAWLNGEESPR